MMTGHTSGPWEWKWGGLWAADTEKNILSVAGGDGDEHVGGSNADKALIAASPLLRAACELFIAARQYNATEKARQLAYDAGKAALAAAKGE